MFVIVDQKATGEQGQEFGKIIEVAALRNLGTHHRYWVKQERPGPDELQV